MDIAQRPVIMLVFFLMFIVTKHCPDGRGTRMFQFADNKSLKGKNQSFQVKKKGSIFQQKKKKKEEKVHFGRLHVMLRIQLVSSHLDSR